MPPHVAPAEFPAYRCKYPSCTNPTWDGKAGYCSTTCQQAHDELVADVGSPDPERIRLIEHLGNLPDEMADQEVAKHPGRPVPGTKFKSMVVSLSLRIEEPT